MKYKELFKTKADNENTKPKVLLALAGGGSHGAFTAGVSQALEENGIMDLVVGVTGTSAGANNAVCVAAGMAEKEPGGVTRLGKKLWSGIGRKGDSLKLFKDWHRMMFGVRWPNLPSSLKDSMSIVSQTSEYYGAKSQAGHVRDHIDDVIEDWDVVRNSDIKVVIGAAMVALDSDGRKVLIEKNFTNKEIDADAVGASGCLVGTHVKDGQHYKDGAYIKNPPISNVMPEDEYTDVIAIMLAPEPEITTCGHEDTLIPNDDLIREETYSHLAYEVKRGKHNVHVIKMTLPDYINDTSKLNFDTKWINQLYSDGYKAGLEWVKAHKKDLGMRSSHNPKTACETALQNDCAVA